MRIIGGKFKGRKFYPPKSLPVRPTTDFAKEALFNILNNRIDIESSMVMDLFAGTGNMGLEFLSRGATSVTSIDQSPACVKYMYQLKKDLNLNDWNIYRADIRKGFQRIKDTFDIVFADPPYDMKNLEQILEIVLSSEIINPKGLFIFEHSKRVNFVNHPQFVESKNYGNVNFTFFQPLKHE